MKSKSAIKGNFKTERQCGQIIRGFTLIELLVTIAVLVIITTIAVPSFRNMMDKNRVKGVAETLYADLQYARSEAIKQNQNVFVYFSTNGTTTWCYALDDDTSTACSCSAVANCTVLGQQRVVDSSDFINIKLSQNFGDNDTVFDPVRGGLRAPPNDNGTATLTSAAGNDVKIIVSSVGRVRICSDDLWDYEAC